MTAVASSLDKHYSTWRLLLAQSLMLVLVLLAQSMYKRTLDPLPERYHPPACVESVLYIMWLFSAFSTCSWCNVVATDTPVCLCSSTWPPSLPSSVHRMPFCTHLYWTMVLLWQSLAGNRWNNIVHQCVLRDDLEHVPVSHPKYILKSGLWLIKPDRDLLHHWSNLFEPLFIFWHRKNGIVYPLAEIRLWCSVITVLKLWIA